MSLFSYIAFPRQVDTSCLISKVDESKRVTVAELKGTELECLYQGLPDEMRIYLGDITDYDEMRIFELDSASFRGVFKNDFVYCLEARFDFCDSKEAIDRGMEIFRKLTEAQKDGMTEDEFMEGLIKGNNDTKNYVTLCRQQLYDIVQLNTQPDEIVEIYSVWGDHNTFDFGPPVETKSIYVERISTSESLDLQDNVKFEIHRTI